MPSPDTPRSLPQPPQTPPLPTVFLFLKEIQEWKNLILIKWVGGLPLDYFYLYYQQKGRRLLKLFNKLSKFNPLGQTKNLYEVLYFRGYMSKFYNLKCSLKSK